MAMRKSGGVYNLPPVPNHRLTLDSLILVKRVSEPDEAKRGSVYKKLPFEPKHFVEGPKMDRAPDPLRASVLIHEYDRCWSAEHRKREPEGKLPPVTDQTGRLSISHRPSVGNVQQIKSRISRLSVLEPTESGGFAVKSRASLAQTGRGSQLWGSFSTPVLQQAGSRPSQMQDPFPLAEPLKTDMQPAHPFQGSSSFATLPPANPASQQVEKCKERKLTREESQKMVERLSKPRRQPKEIFNLPEIERHGSFVAQAQAGNIKAAQTLSRVAKRHHDALPRYKTLYKDESSWRIKIKKGDHANPAIVEETLTPEHQARIKKAFQRHLVSMFGNLEDAWARLDPDGLGALGWTTFVAACGRQGIPFDAQLKLLFKCCADADLSLVTFESLSDGFTPSLVSHDEPKMLTSAAPVGDSNQLQSIQNQAPVAKALTPPIESKNVQEPTPALMQIAEVAADSPESQASVQEEALGPTGSALKDAESPPQNPDETTAEENLETNPTAVPQLPTVESVDDEVPGLGDESRYDEEFEQDKSQDLPHEYSAEFEDDVAPGGEGMDAEEAVQKTAKDEDPQEEDVYEDGQFEASSD